MADDPAKPPLSAPMAQALAEDAAEARAKASQAPQAVADPEPQPEPEPAASAEPEPTGEPSAVEPETKPAKKPRTTEEVMASRIGAKTKEAAEAKVRAEKAEARAAAAEALLAAQGKTVEPDAAPATSPSGERLFTQAEVQAEARKVAAAQAFTDRANETYIAGKDKFGDWDSKMAALGQAGLYSDQLLEAAMESGAPIEVMHHLATELGEAERLTELSPVRMGAEIAKLATKLAGPKAARVSNAPAPVEPVNGSVTPAIDLARLADGDNMQLYADARAKMGDPYAKRRARP